MKNDPKWLGNRRILMKISANEVRKQLSEGHPSIQTVGDSTNVGITTWMMVPGQERIVAKRIKEILSSVI